MFQRPTPHPCIDIHERLEDFERLYKENGFFVGHGSQTFHSKMHGIVWNVVQEISILWDQLGVKKIDQRQKS